jgi:hypothetical protein
VKHVRLGSIQWAANVWRGKCLSWPGRLSRSSRSESKVGSEYFCPLSPSPSPRTKPGGEEAGKSFPGVGDETRTRRVRDATPVQVKRQPNSPLLPAPPDCCRLRVRLPAQVRRLPSCLRAQLARVCRNLSRVRVLGPLSACARLELRTVIPT